MSKKQSSTPHDALFKLFLRQPETARDFLAFHLPAPIHALCDMKTLKLESSSFIDDDLRERLPIVGYMAHFEYLNGFRKRIYWSREKVLNHADTYSQAFSKEAYDKIQNGQIADKDMWKYSSFWYKDFDSMAYKTMLRQLISKWGIMSTEIQQAFIDDGSVLTADPRTGEIITDHSDELELTTDAPQPAVEGSAPAQLQENAGEPEQIDLNSL